MLAVYHEAPWTPSLPGEQILSGWQQHAGLFGHNTNTSGGSENSSSSRPSSNSWTSFLKPHFEPDPAPEPEQHLLPWQMDKGGNRSLIDGVKEDAEQVEDWDEYMKSMLDWDRPQRADHWPPYGEYVGKEYDPNRWEGFERYVRRSLVLQPDTNIKKALLTHVLYRDERIFHASHDKLDPDSATSPKYYRPYPKYNSQAWRKKWKGRYIACDGPRGVPLDDENTEDIVQVYKGVPSGSPRVFAGGYDALGLDGDVCFDRYILCFPFCAIKGKKAEAEKLHLVTPVMVPMA